MLVQSFSSLRQSETRLGQILVRKGLLSAAQLEQILNVQHQYSLSQRLGELLIEYGCISIPDLESALQEQFWRQNGFWIID